VKENADREAVANEVLALPSVPVGDSDTAQLGDPIDVFGYPLVGGDSLTYTTGVVSGFNFEEPSESRAWITTDATLSGGASRGAGLFAAALYCDPPRDDQWQPVMATCSVRNSKNFNRMHTHLARLEAEQANADDVVLLDDRGPLTESRGASVFLDRGGALYTPRGGILEGITRETVFEIAAELAIPAAERDLTPYDLYTASGIFPVVEVDGRTVGCGTLGSMTHRIRERYWERHLSGPDVTPVLA
jgi:hypothetical protein